MGGVREKDNDVEGKRAGDGSRPSGMESNLLRIGFAEEGLGRQRRGEVEGWEEGRRFRSAGKIGGGEGWVGG